MIINALIFSHIIHSPKKYRNRSLTTLRYFFVPLQPEEHKVLPLYEK